MLNSCNKFQIENILFAEYTCAIDKKSISSWTHTDYLVHVISGKKILHTTNGSWNAEPGQTLFFKKGAAIINQFFDADFCVFLFFIPNNLIKGILKEFTEGDINVLPNIGIQESVIQVNNDVEITAFFQSMRVYFSAVQKPSAPLLKLKLKELIFSILVNRNNPTLSSYLYSLANSKAPRISEIMEANFRCNLSLEEFAGLCHRSLSSFKRDFEKTFAETPGRWLLKRRLEYAAVILRTNEMNISQIVFECGFEDLSHFCRAFKDKFGVSPTEFRNQPQTTTIILSK